MSPKNGVGVGVGMGVGMGGIELGTQWLNGVSLEGITRCMFLNLDGNTEFGEIITCGNLTSYFISR